MITTRDNRIWLVVAGLALVGGLAFMVGRTLARSPAGRGGAPPPSRQETLSVSPSLAPQDGRVSFQARGFEPGETVIFRVGPGSSGSANLELARARADAAGTANAGPITLPDDLYSGTHPLVAVGQPGGQRATATLRVHAKAPWINVSTNGIKPLATFGLIVGGFQPGEAIQVSFEPAPRGPNGESQDPTKLSKPTAFATLRADDVGNTSWAQKQFPLLRPGAYTL